MGSYRNPFTNRVYCPGRNGKPAEGHFETLSKIFEW